MSIALSDGDYLHGPELMQAINAHQDQAVESGCGVTEEATPAMGVDVAAGVIRHGGPVTVNATNLTVEAADSEDRFDVVSVQSDGTPVITKGTAAPDSNTPPSAPDVPGTNVLLAVVTVEADTTSIQNADIRDSRILKTQGAAGSDNELQFNDGGSLAGIPEVTWDDTRFAIAAEFAATGDTRLGNATFDGSDPGIEASLIGASPEFGVFGADNAAPPKYTSRRARGTPAAPTATQSGDDILRFEAQGWTGSGWGIGAIIEVESTNDWSTDRDAKFRWSAGEQGSFGVMELGPREWRLDLLDAAGANIIIDDGADTADQSAMQLAVDSGGSPVVSRVTAGADDSGGTGFRVLRVPN